MTDAYTDELFSSALAEAGSVVFPVSRLILDPERFKDDAEEPMAARGMGVVYERTSDGATLRKRPRAEERDDLLDRFYRPHHADLTRCVSTTVARCGRCLIIDGHSFPSVPLPYEQDQDKDRPDICIGVDDFHTPAALRDAAVAAAKNLGWSVLVDRPFAGAIVPLTHYRKDSRVASIMVEVNRRIYMDEHTGRRLPDFADVRARLSELIRELDSSL